MTQVLIFPDLDCFSGQCVDPVIPTRFSSFAEVTVTSFPWSFLSLLLVPNMISKIYFACCGRVNFPSPSPKVARKECSSRGSLPSYAFPRPAFFTTLSFFPLVLFITILL